jgi:prepilin-type N-terminal cleavage/methylation domain-containing protein
MILPTRKTQQGFTLVEMMVAILISIIMMGVAMTQLLGSRTLFALHEADSRIEENARYALEVLTQNIRLASYTDIRNSSQEAVTGQFFNLNCDAIDFNPCTDDGAGTSSDHFAVWYNPPPSNEVTCGGVILVGTNASSSIVDVFYIAADDDTGINGLRCRSYSISTGKVATLIANSDQPIIEGVENMQILYGMTDQSSTSSMPVRYVSATTVNAIAAAPGLRDKWASIVSARVTILVGTGFDDSAVREASRIYSVGDAPAITLTDRNRRKIFSSTVAINNANL